MYIRKDSRAPNDQSSFAAQITAENAICNAQSHLTTITHEPVNKTYIKPHLIIQSAQIDLNYKINVDKIYTYFI